MKKFFITLMSSLSLLSWHVQAYNKQDIEKIYHITKVLTPAAFAVSYGMQYGACKNMISTLKGDAPKVNKAAIEQELERLKVEKNKITPDYDFLQQTQKENDKKLKDLKEKRENASLSDEEERIIKEIEKDQKSVAKKILEHERYDAAIAGQNERIINLPTTIQEIIKRYLKNINSQDTYGFNVLPPLHDLFPLLVIYMHYISSATLEKHPSFVVKALHRIKIALEKNPLYLTKQFSRQIHERLNHDAKVSINNLESASSWQYIFPSDKYGAKLVGIELIKALAEEAAFYHIHKYLQENVTGNDKADIRRTRQVVFNAATVFAVNLILGISLVGLNHLTNVQAPYTDIDPINNSIKIFISSAAIEGLGAFLAKNVDPEFGSQQSEQLSASSSTNADSLEQATFHNEA